MNDFFPFSFLFFILLIVSVILFTLIFSIISKQKDEIKIMKKQIDILIRKGLENDKSKSANSVYQENYRPYHTQKSAASNISDTAEIPDIPAFHQPAPVYKQNVYQNYQPVYTPAVNSKSKDTNSFENWFGKNVLGIAASILVFIALVLLAVLSFQYITETVKIIAMFVISGIAAFSGIALSIKNKNTFSTTLTGCGFGAFFISILMTHVYFNAYSDIAAFSLLLVWLVIALASSKIFKSTALSVVAHIGIIISVCTAYAMGLSDEKLLIIMLYQLVSIAIIITGNILCCRKTYILGAFVSLTLTIISSLSMYFTFVTPLYSSKPVDSIFSTNLNSGFIITAFAVQFIVASIISYLLAVSTNRLKDNALRVLAHLANKALWFISLYINIYLISYTALSNKTYFGTLTASLICIGIVLIHSAVTLVMSQKLNFSKLLEAISIFLLGGFCAVMVLNLNQFLFEILPYYPKISNLIFVIAGFLAVQRITKNNNYFIAADILLGIDSLYMLLSGYSAINSQYTIASSLVYMVIPIVIVWYQRYIQSKGNGTASCTAVKNISYIFMELSLVSIFLSSKINYSFEILLIILTAINLFANYIKMERIQESSPAATRTVLLINEIILILINAFSISYNHKDSISVIFYLFLFILTFTLGFIRIKEVIRNKNSALGVWLGIKLTIIVLSFVNGHTAFFNYYYVFSLLCMVTAFVCIVLGFKININSLRLYGLILTLICVIKLVTIDIGDIETIYRIIALICGGLICFAVSAIYNYTSKKFLAETKKDNLPKT